MDILLVDDDEDIRILLARKLKKWGHNVISASNGVEAWKILQKEQISFVISDWMMPEMDGPQLCAHIRKAPFSHYIYIILLTARDDTHDLVKGMEAGADDFVVKPFKKEELNVRIRAGERVLKLERVLEERNQKLTEANNELKNAYTVIKKDLEAAAQMQKSLLPHSAGEISGFKFDWIFNPCSFVAGDIFNFFPLNKDVICFYLLDVAGHGIPAAMLSVTLSKILSPLPDDRRILETFDSDTSRHKLASPLLASPLAVMEELNNRFQKKMDSMQYFTMVYGTININSGKARISQAGHPCPILLNNKGEAILLGTGGFPIGIIPDAEYDEVEFDFNSGDRIFLYSDGITECMNESLAQYSEERLMNMVLQWNHLPLDKLLLNLESDLIAWKGKAELEDDVTLLAIERK